MDSSLITSSLITPFYISNADFSLYKIYNTFYYIFQNSGMFRNIN